MMKKLAFFLFAALLSLQYMYADDVVIKNINQLPAQARTFLGEYFAKQVPKMIKMDKENNTVKYSVEYANDIEVEFDADGKWTKIDMNKKAVPAKLIPTFVSDYMKKNQLDKKIVTEVKHCSEGYEIDLNDNQTLYFFNDGKFDKVVKSK